ncbi:MAG TPA: T9SS type A sorting domain-containing protein [Flavobacterium sp.]
MRKTLLFLIALIGMSASAQSIGILGSATPTGWDVDTDMTTTDNINYTITMTFTNGAVKFRENDSWTPTNWGGGTFPSGTATLNGSDITGVLAGTYTVTFNRNTGAYNFAGSSTYPVISVIGTAAAGWETDIDMTTSDGINYILSAYTFSSGVMKFREGHVWTGNNWGSGTFPTGTATLGGDDMTIPAGTYTVTFNRTTGAFNFGFPGVGIVGSATGSWDIDNNMETTDGVLYTLEGLTLVAGKIKFRQDGMWTVSWGGGGFNPAVLVLGGSDIDVGAGTFDFTFNRNTLEWSMTPSILAINEQSAKRFIVYPNPSVSRWNISSTTAITAVRVMDVTGKMVIAVEPNADNTIIDASGLGSGIYFAKISSANGSETVKLIKE